MRTQLAVVATAAALAGAATGYLLAPTLGSASARDGVAALPPTVAREAPKHSARTMHVALNMEAGDRAEAAALGYDLFDVGPGEVDALPQGAKALVWVGNTACGSFEMSEDAFASTVRGLAKNPRVYAWYLSDEPNPDECPEVTGQIRRRADIVHRYAPGQKTFASLTDWGLSGLTPAATHLDLVGVDPYPCRVGKACDLDTIDTMVRQVARAGYAKRMMVPVFQTFGQSCNRGEKAWRLPTAGQLQSILDRWRRLVPAPAFEISYSWGRQAEWACPTLADSEALQAVMKRHNARASEIPPARPAPGTSATPSATPSCKP